MAWLVAGLSQRHLYPFTRRSNPEERATFCRAVDSGCTGDLCGAPLRWPDACFQLPSPVRHGLERTWLADIAVAGQHAAWAAFQRYVASPGDLVREHPPWHPERPPSDRYDAFISHQLREGLAPLFREFPVLARDLALVAETGAQAALEFCGVSTQDRDVISEAFAQGRDLGTLTDLHGGLSDPHGGRRRVSALTFSSGLRLVYKPRDVRLESGFSDMVAWLGARGLAGAPPTARVVARDRYGWAEFIPPSGCRDESQARQAYDAAGVLLCLAWALGARDLHWQNVIATSRGPVLIDLETLLQPEGFAAATANLPSGSVKSPGTADGAACLSSGLLSSLETRGDGQAVEVGGLRGRADRVPPVEVVEWSNLRTDALEKHIARRAVPPGLNLITVSGQAEDPASYRGSVLEGYRRAYQSLLAHRDALVGAEGLMARWFGSGSSRLVLRPTRLYGEALAALREPQFLRDGITRGIALETLNRPFSSRHQRPRVGRSRRRNVVRSQHSISRGSACEPTNGACARHATQAISFAAAASPLSTRGSRRCPRTSWLRTKLPSPTRSRYRSARDTQ